MSNENIVLDVRNAKNAIFDANKTFSNHERLLSTKWTGEINTEYKNFYRQFINRTNTIINNYSNMVSKLDSLGRSIKKAEDEKARKMMKK